MGFRLIVVLAFLLAGCSSSSVPIYQLGTQSWHDLDITIEARPDSGDNYEFLVIATSGGRKPAHDLIVHIRVKQQDIWKQAMQDGRVGVYRRAGKILPQDEGVLFVQLQRGGEQGELQFPLKQKLTP